MKEKQVPKVSINLYWLLALLAGVIVAMLLIWQPWSTSTTTTRTISTSGTAQLKVEPDLYTFSPRYQVEADTNDEVIAGLSAKSDEVLAGLKAIGVTDDQIKTNTSSFDYYRYFEEDSQNIGSFSVTIELNSKDKAQEVQDYLLTTSPEGQISPYASFSEAKKKELEAEVRSLAIEDAKKSAERTASDLEASLGKVVSIKDGGLGNGVIYPQVYELDVAVGASSESSIAVQPGVNEFSFSVEVVFELK